MDLSRWPRCVLLLSMLELIPSALLAQGVTTAAVNGLITSIDGAPIAEANVAAVHVPSGTRYRAVSRAGGAYSLPNLRVGGPYQVTATAIGFQPRMEENVFLSLNENRRLDIRLTPQPVQLQELVVAGQRD